MSVAAAANLVTGRKPRPAHEQRWGMPIPSVDQSLAMMLLPTVLSLIAGSCDIITFIGLGGLFTAHITGNLVASGAPIDPTDGKALTAGMLAVSGMAVQNAIVQVSIKGMPSTAVMTTNVSRFVADFIAVLTERNRDLAAKAAARAKHTAPAIVGFAVGCGLGAGCEIIIGLWALALPTGLAFLALVIGLATKLEERP
jgi:uncharacterized membrane protein YoaK (UPF0700 family)